MKLSRNVLVGSLAVSGMVLGALAPAMTAQAATTTGTVDTNGNVTGVAPKEIGALPGNKELAIAYDGKMADGTTDASGLATATSNASVKVIDGVLVLNEVPDFNFGTAVSGQTKDLVDNTKDTSTMSATNAKNNVDGNSQGRLSVLESRDTKTAKGFNLTAALGAFTDASGNVAGATDTTGAAATANPFTLTLNAVPVTDGQNQIDNGSTGMTTTAASLVSSIDASKPGTAATVMNVAAGSTEYKQGEYLAEYTAANNSATPSKEAGATLKVPNLNQDGSKAKVQSLNAPITWTLSAAASTN